MVNTTLITLKKRFILAGTFIFGSLISACGGSTMTKFDWLATESAPDGFPMIIIRGSFIAPDGTSLYIPSGARVDLGWGNMSSSHVVGPDLKSLPSRVEIEFFSYTENVFYKGEFELPYDTIVRLFNEGYYSSKEKGHTTYQRIMVGMAPGGGVAVWLLGMNRITEVFYGKAEKAQDIPWTKVTKATGITREAYIHVVLNDAIGINKINELKQIGIPLARWDSYRVHYPWQPVIIADNPPTLINGVFYFNGEEDYFRYPLDEQTASALRPIPREIYYRWDNPDGDIEYPEFHFDEVEIYAAFKRLCPDGLTPLKLEFHTRKIDGVQQFAIQLSNENEVVVLEKTFREN